MPPAAFPYRRLTAVVLMVLTAFVSLGLRLYHIQIRRHSELTLKAQRFIEYDQILEAWRGEIRDHAGRVLALSVPIKTIYADPTLCSNRVEQVARTCAPLLQMPVEELAGRLRAALQPSSGAKSSSCKAIVLRRNVPVAEWNIIRTALRLENFSFASPGLTRAEKAELWKLQRRLLFARDSQLRIYPYGECLSHVLGFTSARTNGSGLQGMCGIEAGFDQELAGEDGHCLSEQDATGDELPLRRVQYKPPENGANVILTIDLRLQRIAEQVLTEAIRKHHPRSASAVLLDPRTCEILALASLPNFDPGKPGASPPETWRNPIIQDKVEPGSTFKLVTLAGALENRMVSLESGVYCEEGRFVVNKVAVQDHAPYGLLTVRQGFAKSSNIALSKLALQLGPQRFYNCITNFGFGRATGVAFPGETPGLINPDSAWSTMRLTRAAFGQGISVSQLQMALAFAAVANQGRLMRPLLVNRLEKSTGQMIQEFRPQILRSVVSPRTAEDLTSALKAVVSREGTGAAAASPNYTIAAKTGTAQKSNKSGYLPGRYYSSMIGFLPADAPQIVISIAMDEPVNGYYAGTVVAPAFRALAEQVAAHLGIPLEKKALIMASSSQ